MFRLNRILAVGAVLACMTFISSVQAKPPALMSPYRTWKDASGRFEVVAALESVNEGNVMLRSKAKNTALQVPMGRLSQADQAYVKNLLITPVKTEEPPTDQIAATSVVLRRDFGSSQSSTDSGVLLFTDDQFGYVLGCGTMQFPGSSPNVPERSPPSPEIELPAGALGMWRATFYYGQSGESSKMLKPVLSGDRPIPALAKVPLGKLPTPLLSRETALPVAGSKVKVVGFHLQERSGGAPFIVRRTCAATVSDFKGDAAGLRDFYIEGAELDTITSGVVLDSQDRVVGVVLSGQPSRNRYSSFRPSTPKSKVRTVDSLRSSIAPVLQTHRDSSVIYAESWSDSDVSLEFDVWVWDWLGRGDKLGLLIRRHSGPLPKARQISQDDWAPILPDMTMVPLAATPVDPRSSRPSAGRLRLKSKWRDPQGVDGQHALRYAVQLQWTDVAGKTRRSVPKILSPRPCSKTEWHRMYSVLNRMSLQQAAPASDGTIRLTSKSTQGWPGSSEFATKLTGAAPQPSSSPAKLEFSALKIGKDECHVCNLDEFSHSFRAPAWSSDGKAFFLLSSDGLLRKVSRADFRVLRSVQLVDSANTEARRRQFTLASISPSSEGLIAMVADGWPAKYWLLDEDTLAVKRGFSMRATTFVSSRTSPIAYVWNHNGLTLVDMRSGKVLHHLGRREQLYESTEPSEGTTGGGGRPYITLDGQYMVQAPGFARGDVLPPVFRIDGDQLIFDAKVAATMPVHMTRYRILGLSLGRRLEEAAQQHKAQVPFELMDDNSQVAISPNGKEIVMVVRHAMIHSPNLPDTSYFEQIELKQRKR